METKPTYKTIRQQDKPPCYWLCKGCGEVLGYIQSKSSGAAWLLRHGDRLYYAQIFCDECGAAQLWMPNQASFEALMRRFGLEAAEK